MKNNFLFLDKELYVKLGKMKENSLKKPEEVVVIGHH